MLKLSSAFLFCNVCVAINLFTIPSGYVAGFYFSLVLACAVLSLCLTFLTRTKEEKTYVIDRLSSMIAIGCFLIGCLAIYKTLVPGAENICVM